MPTYLYPTAAELTEIEQSLLPTLTMDDELFKILPIENQDTDLVIWEQEDDYIGLQQARTLNSPANKADPVGLKRYIMQPGYYAEFMTVDEQELTRRRAIGTFSQPIDITDLVRRRQNQLLTRQINRIRQIGWTLLATGTFSVPAPAGGIVHTDTYAPQTFSATVPWATSATATPLADFRAVQLKSRGFSVSFGKDAVAYMNRTTWNRFISNTNAADLFGRRTAGLGTFENIEDVNKLLTGDDLPMIFVFDETYRDDTGAVQLFLPDNKVVVVGKRKDKRPIGAYAMTRNASNPNLAPGPFTAVVDSADYGRPVPRQIEVINSHNGGPKLFFPSAIVIMTVS